MDQTCFVSIWPSTLLRFEQAAQLRELPLRFIFCQVLLASKRRRSLVAVFSHELVEPAVVLVQEKELLARVELHELEDHLNAVVRNPFRFSAPNGETHVGRPVLLEDEDWVLEDQRLSEVVCQSRNKPKTIGRVSELEEDELQRHVDVSVPVSDEGDAAELDDYVAVRVDS